MPTRKGKELQVKSIRKERPLAPIEIILPPSYSGAIGYRYRRYENGNWSRSDDGGKTWGNQNLTGQEIAILTQLLRIYVRRNGSTW